MKINHEIMDRFGIIFIFGTKKARIGIAFFLFTITYPTRIKPIINLKWV